MMFSREKPPKNYDSFETYTVIKIRISTITWDDDYSKALEDTFLSTTEISKTIIKGLCEGTNTTYLDKKHEIDFLHLLDGRIEKALAGALFFWSKVKQSIEMARINQQLLIGINDSKSIIMRVGVMMANKRDAILMRQAYVKNIVNWTTKK